MVSEVGDAGGLPGTAQIITENVTFNNRDIEISGEIEGAADEDMYGFEISVPSVFSAQDVSVSGMMTSEDTQLLLFDENGNGVCANDDDPESVLGSLRGHLPVGRCAFPTLLPAGIYFLAISTSSRDPVDAQDNKMFPDGIAAARVVVPPVDGVGPIAGWVGTSQGGTYLIRITGANFPPPMCTLSVVSDPDDQGRRLISLQAFDNVSSLMSVAVTSRDNNISSVVVTDENGDVIATPEALPAGTTRVTITATAENLNEDAQAEVQVTNTLGVSNRTPCILNAPQAPEQPAIAPTCVDVFSLEGLPAVETTVQDLQSGLSLIQLLFVKNANVTVDGNPLPTASGDRFIAFNPPTRDPVVIRAEKIDLSQRATVLVEVFDNDIPVRNSDICDPILAQIIIPNNGLSVVHTFDDVPEFDHFISVQNGNGTPGSGLTLMTIKVNESPTKIFRLGEGEVKQFDVEADMIPGLNTIVIKGIGQPGTEASVAISNQLPEIAPLSPLATSSFIVRRSSVKQGKVNREWGP